jgi:hypothetical protein
MPYDGNELFPYVAKDPPVVEEGRSPAVSVLPISSGSDI